MLGLPLFRVDDPMREAVSVLENHPYLRSCLYKYLVEDGVKNPIDRKLQSNYSDYCQRLCNKQSVGLNNRSITLSFLTLILRGCSDHLRCSLTQDIHTYLILYIEELALKAAYPNNTRRITPSYFQHSISCLLYFYHRMMIKDAAKRNIPICCIKFQTGALTEDLLIALDLFGTASLNCFLTIVTVYISHRLESVCKGDIDNFDEGLALASHGSWDSVHSLLSLPFVAMIVNALR